MKTAAKAEVLIDNERTRATKWFFEKAGMATGWHRHEYDYMVIPFFDGFLEIDNGSGQNSKVQLYYGTPYFRKAGVEHDVINANDFPCFFIEIEYLK